MNPNRRDGELPASDSAGAGRRVLWTCTSFGVLALICIVVFFVVRHDRHESADPGGHVLTWISGIVGSIPHNSVVIDQRFAEPIQEACDGNEASRGWSDVVAEVDFRSNEPPDILISGISSNLGVQHWRQTSNTSSNGAPAGRWDRDLPNGEAATTQLIRLANHVEWQLTATAPPVGKPATGC